MARWPCGVLDDFLRQRPETVFETARELGFDGLEVVLGLRFARRTEFSAEGRRQLRARADAARVQIPSMTLASLMKDGLAGDAAMQARARQSIVDAIDMASGVGCKTVLLPFYPPNNDLRSGGDLGPLVSAVREAVPAAERAGVVLGIEATVSTAELRSILDELRSPSARVYYDVGNAVWRGFDPAQQIRELGDAIVQVHVKDVVKVPGDCVLGTGRVDLPACVDALDAIGYRGWLVLETLPRPELPFGGQEPNLNKLRELIGT